MILLRAYICQLFKNKNIHKYNRCLKNLGNHSIFEAYKTIEYQVLQTQILVKEMPLMNIFKIEADFSLQSNY